MFTFSILKGELLVFGKSCASCFIFSVKYTMILCTKKKDFKKPSHIDFNLFSFLIFTKSGRRRVNIWCIFVCILMNSWSYYLILCIQFISFSIYYRVLVFHFNWDFVLYREELCLIKKKIEKNTILFSNKNF